MELYQCSQTKESVKILKNDEHDQIKAESTKSTSSGKRKFDIDSIIKSDLQTQQQQSSHCNNRQFLEKEELEESTEQTVHADSKQLKLTEDSCSTYGNNTQNIDSNINTDTSLTISATNSCSKYNVLQVLQPTSTLPRSSMPNERFSPTQASITGESALPQVPGFSEQHCNNTLDLRTQHEETTSSKNCCNRNQYPVEQPSVDISTLMPSLTALATYPMFNWCAKCNASFRMTSDLVQHMRTCHKKRKIDH